QRPADLRSLLSDLLGPGLLSHLRPQATGHERARRLRSVPGPRGRCDRGISHARRRAARRFRDALPQLHAAITTGRKTGPSPGDEVSGPTRSPPASWAALVRIPWAWPDHPQNHSLASCSRPAFFPGRLPAAWLLDHPLGDSGVGPCLATLALFPPAFWAAL